MKRIIIFLALLYPCFLKAGLDELNFNIQIHRAEQTEATLQHVRTSYQELDPLEIEDGRIMLTANQIILDGINDQATLGQLARNFATGSSSSVSGSSTSSTSASAEVQLISDAAASQLEQALTERDQAQTKLKAAQEAVESFSGTNQQLIELAQALEHENAQLATRIDGLRTQISQLPVVAANTTDARQARLIAIEKRQIEQLLNEIAALQAKKDQLNGGNK